MAEHAEQLQTDAERVRSSKAGGVAQPTPGLAAAVLTMQRSAGNRAVGRLLADRADPPSRKNDTGLADGLKAGVESLSGVSLDGVRVHYDSPHPAEVGAEAYARGTDVHVAPGQERHLPHEAWHVAQQAQGRVQPTVQLKSGVPVNDDEGLEREADAMGARAAELGSAAEASARRPSAGAASSPAGAGTVQRVGLNSAKLLLATTGANVSKAPRGFSQNRWAERRDSIDKINNTEIAGGAGSIVGEDVDGGVRIDVQGDFHEGAKTFYNVQAQANDPVNDLTYPPGTRAEQKGSSLGEVHVEDRVAESTKPDVLGRMGRLLKSGLYQSIGDRGTYPRPVYKITHP